jgi:cell division septum initiation protein DivIVA
MPSSFWRVNELKKEVKDLEARINEKNQMASDMRDHVDRLNKRIEELEAEKIKERTSLRNEIANLVVAMQPFANAWNPRMERQLGGFQLVIEHPMNPADPVNVLTGADFRRAREVLGMPCKADG